MHAVIIIASGSKPMGASGAGFGTRKRWKQRLIGRRRDCERIKRREAELGSALSCSRRHKCAVSGGGGRGRGSPSPAACMCAALPGGAAGGGRRPGTQGIKSPLLLRGRHTLLHAPRLPDWSFFFAFLGFFPLFLQGGGGDGAPLPRTSPITPCANS